MSLYKNKAPPDAMLEAGVVQQAGELSIHQ